MPGRAQLRSRGLSCRGRFDEVGWPPVKPPLFTYESPSDLDGALESLAAHRRDAKVLAGGQSLIPLLNFRLARPEVLIDINGITDLDFIRVDADTLRIGALVRHARVEMSLEVARHAALMAEAVRHVGHSQIRNRGTVGGSIAHADPAAELPAGLLALGARLHVRSASGTRHIDLQTFFQGPFTTSLGDDEMLTAVEVPFAADGTGHAFYEFARRRGDFALGGAAVLVTVDERGLCRDAAIALVAADSTPVRATGAEASLIGNAVDDETARAAAEDAVRDISPLGDVHGSAEFRRRVIRELVRRALGTASARARTLSESGS
jgi:CO/xanthine dehydrogenase FAD-binding subunit